MTKPTGIIQETKEAINDTEHSLGEKAPGTPFVSVALSYLAVLALACLVLALIFWML